MRYTRYIGCGCCQYIYIACAMMGLVNHHAGFSGSSLNGTLPRENANLNLHANGQSSTVFFNGKIKANGKRNACLIAWGLKFAFSSKICYKTLQLGTEFRILVWSLHWPVWSLSHFPKIFDQFFFDYFGHVTVLMF